MGKLVLPEDNTLKYSFFKAGKRIFSQGDRGTDIYILQKGAVTVTVDGQIMGLINTPGPIIGEMAYFLGFDRTASIETIEDSTFLVITADFLQETIMKRPEIGLELIRILSERLLNTTKYATRLETDIVTYRNELRKLKGLKEEKKPTVLEELLSQGFIDCSQLAECESELEKVKRRGDPISLPKILIEKGYITADQFIRFLEMKQAR